jgi:NADH:ubiquinone oxidoreductase subunit D
LAEENARASGATVSCKKGCGACCRQLVPVSEIEARQLKELVEQMPEPRRSEIWARFERARELAFERLPRAIDELDYFLSDNEIVKARSIGVGYLPANRSIAYSLTGPCLRAAGVPYDIRRAEPYSIYDRFDWDVPVLYGADVYDRYRLRIMEMRESIKILQQCLNQMEHNSKPGDIQAGKKAYNHRVPAGQAYGRVETPKGELGFYLVSDGAQNPYRYHVRSSSFINLNSLKEMTIGQKIADSVVVLGSLDIVLGEVDR